MHRVFVLSAILAWALFQVPMVGCASACGQSLQHLISLAGHDCHDTESELHRERCCSGKTDHTGRSHPSEAPSEQDDGEHVFVQIQASTADSPVVLADHGATAPFLGDADLPQNGPLTGRNHDSTIREPGPPPLADPVSTADLLLL